MMQLSGRLVVIGNSGRHGLLVNELIGAVEELLTP